MAGKKRSKLFETRYFGLIIGAFVIALFLLLSSYTAVFDRLEMKMLDVHFNFKNVIRKTTVQEGVTVTRRNPNISQDILILGIDFKSLSTFGKWPFPRYRHANLINSFARIQNQNERERSLFIDVFFIEPDEKAHDDAMLVQSIDENDRVFLETVLDVNPPPSSVAEEMFERQEVLAKNYGEVTNIKGPWEEVDPYLGMQPPLKPLGRASEGYGHANFYQDYDQVFRRQQLVAKASKLIEVFKLEELTTDVEVDRSNFERLVWVDTEGIQHNIPYPLTEEQLRRIRTDIQANAPQKAEDTDGDGEPDSYYHIIRKYEDHFLPSITLALALDYFNKTLDEIEVVYGSHINIPSPEYYNMEEEKWEPYAVTEKAAVYDDEGKMIESPVKKVMDEITIPISDQGDMLINFMGVPSSSSPQGHQTFPVRSYAGYAARVPGPAPSTWPRTKAVGNKIIMVGPFAKGIAADEKPTPYGLMYGVEVHANALNTILMNKFLEQVPLWVDIAVLVALVMLTVFLTSRVSTIWSLIISLVLVLAFFIAVTMIFDSQSLIVNFSQPAIGILFGFLAVVVYRVMTEEKDKRRIRSMFGKYVSPKVVDQIIDNPPELGGVDKELTVFFSDIRGFTTLSESMTPQELVNHLNLYLTAMTDIIIEYQGTLDKYVGDEIMSFWGAPIPQDDHAILACKSALKQMNTLHEMNEEWPPEKRINIGIGLNSGIMTVGNMGSSGRMNYTLMGDNVNLGARLEGTNKQYKTNIIISEFTYGLVKDRVLVRELDNIRVKGKNKPVVIYELLDIPEGLEPPKAVDGNGKKSKLA